jgi:hypothetical protein
VALRAAHAGARATAQDLAPGLVETARRLAAEQGPGISFDVGDAERLSYPDASSRSLRTSSRREPACDPLPCRTRNRRGAALLTFALAYRPFRR